MLHKRIDGKAIGDQMLEKLHAEVISTKIHPHLLVLLIGDNPSSQSYIRQKKNAAERIGAICTLLQFPADVSEEIIRNTIHTANLNTDIHGIIVQRPLPSSSQISEQVLNSVDLKKDIDGFLQDSPFEVPVAKAIITILEKIFYEQFNTPQLDLISWLRKQDIVVIGKGVTAGNPIRKILERLGLPVVGIDRSTPNPEEITKGADIIISCVGKQGTIPASAIKSEAILLSVGLSRGTDGKIHGDYEERDIQEKALFYTPTPGGVGPVNVACLMQNLVKATRI